MLIKQKNNSQTGIRFSVIQNENDKFAYILLYNYCSILKKLFMIEHLYSAYKRNIILFCSENIFFQKKKSFFVSYNKNADFRRNSLFEINYFNKLT
jgi:hypothetical protein